MIIGIGVDIVEVADLERRLKRDSFLNIFSDRERAHADALPLQRAEILSGRFAAKEAFGKALGTGLSAGWDLRAIEVINDAKGKPCIQLGRILRDVLPPGTRIHLSISHVKTHAIAFVMIED